MSKQIKDYCEKIREQIKTDNIDLSGLTQSYYQMLKDSNTTNVNKEIIKQLRQYSELNFVRKDLEEIFNKNSILNKDSLEKGFMAISGQLINAVNIQSSDEIYNIDMEDSKKIIQDKIMDWDYFSSYFSSSFEYWQIKEAIGWVAGYIETEDYDPNKILVFKEGELNKKQTLKNILVDINKKSLTAQQPFITRVDDEKKKNKDFGFGFRAAGSGEVDVMLWSEKKQKAIALSVTRDRGVGIEGNQFVRHYIKMLAATLKIKNKYKKEDISRLEARNYLKSSQFKDDRRLHNFHHLSTEVKKEIYQKVTNHENQERHISNHFLRDLTYVRQEMAKSGTLDFTNNMKINKTEMNELLKLGRENLDYTYFGEALKTDSQIMEITSALNSFAYLSNFNNVSNIELGLDNSFKFLNELNFRYNSVDNKDLFNKGAELSAMILIMKPQGFSPIADGFKEGMVYSEERSNLFKSVGNFLKMIKDQPDVEKYLVEELSFDKSIAESVNKAISSNFLVDDLKKKFEQIKCSQSELVSEKETTLLLAENIQQKKMIESLLKQKESTNETLKQKNIQKM